MSETLEYVYATYIRADAEDVWKALTTPEFTSRYFHATHVKSTWRAGDPVQYCYADGRVAVEGEVLEADPPRRLVITWHVLYDEDAQREAPSKVIFTLEPFAEQTRLSITHTAFPAETVVYGRIRDGWPWIISSLKSLLETGQALPLAEAS